MNTEKPRRTDKTVCPLMREPVSKVCHKCDWYVRVQGKNPQGEDVFDHWGCAIAWMPTLQIETSQQSRQAGASADKVANEVAKFHESMAQFNRMNAHLLKSINDSSRAPKNNIKVIEDLGDVGDYGRGAD